MDRGEEIVQEKMRLLIDLSCQFDKLPVEEFRNFHKAILKFYFNAVNVRIDYETQEVFTSNSKPLTTNPVRLFDMNKAVADKFSYSDLSETLAGCLENGNLQNTFYKKLLSKYAVHFNDEAGFLSA